MHSIHFADDDQMPDGHDFIFVTCPDQAIIFYRESALSERVLEESWAAYRAMQRKPPETPTALVPWTPRQLYSVA